jgi:hypothetical protein
MAMKLELLSLESLPVQRRQLVIRSFLEALIVVNWNFLIEHPDFPPLASFVSKSKFKVWPTSLDTWQDIPQVISMGVGDSKDFMCWRVAELRNHGHDDISPHIKVSYFDDREPAYEFKVRNHDDIEDPCAGIAVTH